MRKREDIESSEYKKERIIIEVLLDMRELLEDIKEGRRE